MLRDRIAGSLKDALKRRDDVAVATLRLILAALKDRDIAARPAAGDSGIGDDEIFGMLQTMVRQRRDSIELYEKGARLELAERERAEIKIIEGFLPKQLSPAETEAVVAETVAAVGATGLKDLGRVMAALRQGYAGRMDFGRASAAARLRLNGENQA